MRLIRARLFPILLLAIPGALVFLLVPRICRFVEIFGPHAGIELSEAKIEAAYDDSYNIGGGGGGGSGSGIRSGDRPGGNSGFAPGGGDSGDAEGNENGGNTKNRAEYIPRIIHQIFHNWKDPGDETLPTDWAAARETCVSANPGWEHLLWTDSSSRQFIAENYSWFLPTYEGYRYPVQRADSLRYFLMRHYGGIYIDLDNGCARDLTPLLAYPAWVTDGAHGALSNNILAARPGHPFWKMMTDALVTWDRGYFFPLVTISYASGQWFETAVWQEYHRRLPSRPEAGDRLYRVVMDLRPGSEPWVFFTQGRGGTWESWDQYYFDLFGNVMIPWIGRNLAILAVGSAVLLGMVIYQRWSKRGSGCEVVQAIVV